MLYGVKIEICAGSLEDVLTAAKYQEVDRIELNSHLEEDGLSIDHDSFLAARQMTTQEILCMVRTRPGDFIYTDDIKKEMLAEAKFYLANDADGIVFGCLDHDRNIDCPFTQELIDLAHAHHKTAVFHKAFDVSKDMDASAQKLIEMHCDRILTSGGAPECMSGLKQLSYLNEQYGERIQILPGGGVNAANVLQILQTMHGSSFHMSLRSDSPEQKLIDVLEVIREAHAQNGQHVLTREDQEMFDDDTYEDTMTDHEDTYDHL